MSRASALLLVVAACGGALMSAQPPSADACDATAEPAACLDAGHFWEDSGNHERAAGAYWRACLADSLDGCRAGFRYDTEAAGFPYGERACSLGDDLSCYQLVRFQRDKAKRIAILNAMCARRVESCSRAASVAAEYDSEAAQRMRKRACDARVAVDCEPNSNSLSAGDEWRADIQRACNQGSGHACYELANSGTLDERHTAIERACRLKYERACTILDEQEAERQARDAKEVAQKNRTDALARAKTACEQDSGEACYALRAEGTLTEQRVALERGCRLKYAPACEALGRLRATASPR